MDAGRSSALPIPPSTNITTATISADMIDVKPESETLPSAFVVPQGMKLFTENTSRILLPDTNEAFLNPVQEFNRDVSVAVIGTWGEEMNVGREKRWKERLGKRKRKAKAKGDVIGSANAKGEEEGGRKRVKYVENIDVDEKPEVSMDVAEEAKEVAYRPYKFTILEALSATGLRSIRYAKEIPLVRHVIANDLSPSAIEAMKRNVDLNGLGAPKESEKEPGDRYPKMKGRPQARVRINEGDACTLMYSHREDKDRVDVVDLDPYGTAAPFIDAAVQCVTDGGLLCVTCTDLSVLATTNYPEKCFSNYGGVPVKAEYCHEAALRLVLHTISTSAARYGRYIQPLLSLSIDFYVRLFVKVSSAPIEVKKTLINQSLYYICSGCQTPYEQPLGRVVEKVHDRTGNVNHAFKVRQGPTIPEKCTECDQVLHLAGPMWSGPLHDTAFVEKVLAHLESNGGKYGTVARMKGMLAVAKDELQSPFYFTPSKIAGCFHCTCPPLDDVVSALLHAGHQVSRSHACPGSLKTTASREDVHDVFRSWVKTNPVKMEKISETSPAFKLLSKEPRSEANFERHPGASAFSKVKLVRYQQNPTPNWGPGTKAQVKRKREEVESIY